MYYSFYLAVQKEGFYSRLVKLLASNIGPKKGFAAAFDTNMSIPPNVFAA